MADLPPLPPRKTDQLRPLPPRPNATSANAASAGNASSPVAKSGARTYKPDPRPMRIAYGAGAVAVASVMAVGLVQPDFTATADQQASDDPNAANQGLAQDASSGSNGTGSGRSNQSQANVQVNHVTKYIHLKPGQTAPPGATVIQPGQPTPRIVAANNPAPPPANHNPAPGGNPAPKPPPPPPPPPAPRPTIKTHQSGHP